MNKKFTKKLAAYSAVAAGAVALSSSANAQIQYVDIDPDETYDEDHQLDIDLNSDGVNDFSVLIGSGAGRHAVRVVPGTGNETLGSLSAGLTFFYPFALDINKPVGPSQTVWEGTANGGYGTMAWVYSAGGSYGNWLSAEDKYLGVRFFIGTDLHYGWIRFSITCNPSGVNLVYQDYAYNTVPETEISTGQMSIGIDGTTIAAPKIYTADNLLHVQFESVVKGEVILTNMAGQVVRKIDVEDTETMLSLDELNTGVYMVSVNTSAGRYIQKIFVK